MPLYHTAITQTVEEEEYPHAGCVTGSREQWNHGTHGGGEWTSEGGGESRLCH
ncbi:MAG: hypothetical protein IKJ26_11085 [Clostridia bacterium]|nr:hypothetical protein [Clostridia bacterium]